MKNVLLVAQCDFPGNSAVHVHYFANELVELGLDCVVAVPINKQSVSEMQGSLYKVTQFDERDSLVDMFSNQQPPDIVHAWTPRERVREYCAFLEEAFDFKLIVHLEDNESTLLERFYNKAISDLPVSDVELSKDLSHPRKYREFLNSADGVTVIIDRLQEFISEPIPRLTLWPGVDMSVFSPRTRDANLARQLGIPDGSTVLCYTGNIHPANVAEVKGIYKTVGKRNRQNKPTVLVRTGVTPKDFLSSDERWIAQFIIELGFVERKTIPHLLALADVLIQPGEPDSFNDYRLPSKIPEFLGMGKPLIVPDSNIGRFLTNKKNAIVLPMVNELSLSDAIDMVLEDPLLAQSLSDGALEFARTHLSWRDKGQQLRAFYLEVMCQCRSRRIDWRKRVRELHEELEKARRDLDSCKNRISSMERSRFWKLRKLWLRSKAMLNPEI